MPDDEMSERNIDESDPTRENSSIEWLRRLFGPDIAMLRLAGLRSICSALIGEFKKPTCWEAVFFVKGLVPIGIFISFQCLALVRMWSINRDYAISLFTVLFDSILCAVKGIRLLSQRGELRDILERLKVSWHESVNSAIKDRVTRSAERTSLLCKFYVRITIAYAFTYAIRPYLLLSYYYVFLKKTNVSYDSTQTIYPISYPFSLNTMSAYLLVIAAEQITMMFYTIYWLLGDVLFAKFCALGAIQFRVLSNDLENVGEPEDDDRALIHRLSRIAKRHADALEFCKKINSIYNPIIFLTMLFTSANLCICAFQLDKELSRSNYAEAINHLSHAVTVAIQFSIYCSYAEEVIGAQSIRMAAYNCAWTDRCREFKTIILILLLRAQGSFSFNGYGFFSINHAQITRVSNTAMSYFALLKTIA